MTRRITRCSGNDSAPAAALMNLHKHPIQGTKGCRAPKHRRPMECAGRAQRRRPLGLTVSEPGSCGASQQPANAESRCACLCTPKTALVRPATLSPDLVRNMDEFPVLLPSARRDRKVTVASFVRHGAILTSFIKRSLSYDYETNQRIYQDGPKPPDTNL